MEAEEPDKKTEKLIDLDKFTLGLLYTLKRKLMMIRYNRNMLANPEVLKKQMESFDIVFNKYKKAANELAIGKYKMEKYLIPRQSIYKNKVNGNHNGLSLFLGSGLFGSSIKAYTANMIIVIDNLIKTITKNYYSTEPFTTFQARVFLLRNLELNNAKNKLFQHIYKKYANHNIGGLYVNKKNITKKVSNKPASKKHVKKPRKQTAKKQVNRR